MIAVALIVVAMMGLLCLLYLTTGGHRDDMGIVHHAGQTRL